ncbi:MAG TPA: carbon-nitrogen hydrolase family protein [Candidatus Hydrogenedentes bacterium]|nr:carbon-nitrogen hydrolase family protein [Candidatus Hydrogenedentota bacterium]
MPLSLKTAVALLFGVAAPVGPAEADASDSHRLLRVALLQMDPDGNNQRHNMDKAERFCRQAASLGADIALMPEMWNIGYTRFDADKEGAREAYWAQAVPKDHESIQRFALLAHALDMAIGVTYEQAWSPMPRNAITLFDRHGEEVFTYAKVHTSDFKSLETSMTPGDGFYVGELDTRIGPVQVGAMICFDREQPESARCLMLKGAELILTPNCCGLDDIRLQQFRIRAVENLVGVAMANYPRPYQNGHSVAYDSRGECLVMAGEEEGLFIAAFDILDLRIRRRKSIWGNAYRRPHRYGILTSTEKDPVWERKDGYGELWKAEER